MFSLHLDASLFNTLYIHAWFKKNPWPLVWLWARFFKCLQPSSSVSITYWKKIQIQCGDLLSGSTYNAKSPRSQILWYQCCTNNSKWPPNYKVQHWYLLNKGSTYLPRWQYTKEILDFICSNCDTYSICELGVQQVSVMMVMRFFA
jgi:hypothetical protein